MEQADVSRTYDVLASRYDDWSARVVPDVREPWARKVDTYLAPGERVVELGCGTGLPVGRRLAERYEYQGVDASVEMLARARDAIPAGRLEHADLLTVRVAPGSLGAVVSFFAISHVPREHHARLFDSIASWLRPGGVFVGNLTSRDDPGSVEASWLEAGPMRWSGFDETDNRRLLAASGLRIVDAEVTRLREPDGCVIAPMWFVAERV